MPREELDDLYHILGQGGIEFHESAASGMDEAQTFRM